MKRTLPNTDMVWPCKVIATREHSQQFILILVALWCTGTFNNLNTTRFISAQCHTLLCAWKSSPQELALRVCEECVETAGLRAFAYRSFFSFGTH